MNTVIRIRKMGVEAQLDSNITGQNAFNLVSKNSGSVICGLTLRKMTSDTTANFNWVADPPDPSTINIGDYVVATG